MNSPRQPVESTQEVPGENLESAWSRLQVQPVETVGDEKNVSVSQICCFMFKGFGMVWAFVGTC